MRSATVVLDAGAGGRAGPGPRTVATIALLCLAATAWVRQLMLPDEGRYVGVAYEMWRSGDWLTPTLDGLPFFHKPPLFYWITAASMSVFGEHELAYRAASLVGAWAVVVAMWWLARRWCGARVAHLTAAALVAQPLVLGGGQFANLDMLVAGCITVSIVLLADAVLRLESGEAATRPLAGAYAAMALGVLAKGLIGVVLPALVLGLVLLFTRRLRLLPRLVWLPGIALGLVIAVPWFAAMQMRFPGFLHYFFVVQHFQRYASGGFNNVQPAWFYVAVLAVFCLPWWPWVRRGAGRTPERISTGSAAPAVADAAVFLRVLMWTWAAVVVLFFSLPQSKLVGYVLPAVPPLAWLAASGFASLASPTAGQRALWTGGLVLGAAVSVAAVTWLGLHPRKTTQPVARALRDARAPGEQVFMLGRYDYDVPVYARLREPVGVVDDWSAPGVRRADDWRRELLDAADFAPGPASAVLISHAALGASLCAGRASWVIGGAAEVPHFPFLAGLAPVATQGDLNLWKVEAPALARAGACAGRPSDGSPSTSPPPRPAARPPAPPDS